MTMAIPSFTVETGTRASRLSAIAVTALLLLAFAAPFIVSRGVIQDLFFILTMLVLAQNWNLLAGYAGLISVGQQVFVGFGAYTMFGCVILFGVDPVVAILIAGVFPPPSPFPRPSSPSASTVLISPSAPGWWPRSCGCCWPSGRRSAVAPAPRCRGMRPAT